MCAYTEVDFAVSAIAELLRQLERDELVELAERLRPFLIADDGWLDAARGGAPYAGCTVPGLRYAMAKGEVAFEQRVSGGKVYFRRSALDQLGSQAP